jgi:hypothetical protein
MTLRALPLLLLLLSAPALAFGPWDAGASRDIERQGRKGKARAAHPMVGEQAKVPASGPPPPPLRRDVDIGEHEILGNPNARARGLSANPLYLAAIFYRSFLTHVDGARCAHYPTCSRLANQAVAREGALGFLIGLDRLIQDDNSSVLRKLPLFDHFGTPRIFDPVTNYLWWRKDFGAFPPPAPEVGLALE